ncbi:MAG: zinc-ribbon domain-containing protein [Clostridia bacterium]|nr:zinc-ribbon domain-containing protein [Clostridia bacterium]
MKICQHCQAQLDDGALFCKVCGAKISTESGASRQQTYVHDAPMYDPYDRTAEFDRKDISDNKVYAMLLYLMGVVGILIALLASGSSPYVKFHLRQALKFKVVSILTGIVALVFCWTVIVPIVWAIFEGVLFVIKLICFFQICVGEAKEPAIIRSLGFLK